MLLCVEEHKISATDFTNDCTLYISMRNTETDVLLTLEQVEQFKRKNRYQNTHQCVLPQNNQK